MAEIIDILIVFWAILALVVYVAGNVYESNCKSNKKDRRKSSTIGQTVHDWSAYPTASSASASQHQNITSNAGPFLDYQTPAYSSNYGQQQSRKFSTDISSSRARQNEYNQTSDYYSTYHNYGSNLGFDPYMSEQVHPNEQFHDQSLGRQEHYSALGSANSQANSQSHFAHHPSEHHQFDSARSSSIPTASGYNSDCVEWVNSILYLFHTRQDKYGPIIAENIIRSLNEKASSITSLSDDYSDLIIEFNGLNPEASSRPELTNIRTESESDRSVSVNCKIYNKRISFNITIRLLAPIGVASGANATNYNDFEMQKHQPVQYELILENLEGKLKSMAMLNDKLIVIQFLERPDTKIFLKRQYDPVGTQFGARSSPSPINEDILVQIVLQTLTQVVVDLYFGDDLDFPQFKQTSPSQHQSTYANYKNKINTILRGVSPSELKRQIKHDFFGALSSSNVHEKERKLFIKIVRAKNINYNQNVSCLLELDSPHQQAISSMKQGSNPFWDEHFLFTANEKSQALTLELWDSINLSALNDEQQKTAPAGSHRKDTPKAQAASKANNNNNKWHKGDLIAAAKFLGLARVSMDELRQNPVQKLNLTLQPIGTASDLSNSVGGELQVELLFLEHSASPNGTPAAATSPEKSPLKKSHSANSLSYQHGDVVSIDRKLTPSGYVITTTTITKQPTGTNDGLRPKQAPKAANQASATQSISGTLGRGQSSSPLPSMAVTELSLGELNLDAASSSHLSNDLSQQHHPDHYSVAPSESTGGRASRSRSRSRSILRAIRKRFSFSRTRSRSVGEPSGHDYRPGEAPDSPSVLGTNEALSLDSRSRASSEVSFSGRAKSVPASRDLGEVPTIVINKSRLSDTASALTFTHPKSQLVIEVLEPVLRNDGSGNKQKGRYRYYAVPDDAADKRKWSKRGNKLHLFNEHQFVACHLPGSCTCHLCGRVFARRPGKQGYRCRNCHLLSHKQCHVKVDHNCPYASRDGLKLEYIDSDPPANLIDELNQTNASVTPDSQTLDYGRPNYHEASQQGAISRPTRGKPIRVTAKSISMEVDDR